MKSLDREVILGRTVRELVCIAGGLGIITFEAVRPLPIDWPNMAVYIGATSLFALRFYAARAAAVATCLGAVVQQWPSLRLGEVDWETLALFPLVAFVVLASSDLVDRFERAPSRVRWRRRNSASVLNMTTTSGTAGLCTSILQSSAQPFTPGNIDSKMRPVPN